MIFVTAGTTMPFDELFEEVDRLAGENFFNEELICQSGQTSYQMRHAVQFRGRPSIDDLIAGASLVLSHGGATVVQLLLARKLFVAFPNPRGAGNHQTSFLSTIAGVSDISWSADVRDVARLVGERRKAGPAQLRAGFPRAAEVIRGLL